MGSPPVRLETLLPLGKVDQGLRAPETALDIWSVGADARLLEEVGCTPSYSAKVTLPAVQRGAARSGGSLETFRVCTKPLAAEAKLLSKAQRWEELPALIDDAVSNQFAVIGTYDEIGRKLLSRFSGVVTDIESSISVRGSSDRQTLADLARTVQQADDSAARAAIAGAGADTATGE